MEADREPRDGRIGSKWSRLGSAWGAHVPDHVIALLRDHPDGTPIAEGEPTDAVVLVADVAGFTPMSEALARSGHYGVEELGGILNAWFDAMNERIRHYGGSLAEFAGDALIAEFGCDAGARHATTRRAVQCALEMQAAMVRFQPVATRAGSFHLTMKVGLAAGLLLQTVMGDPAVRVGPVLLGPALQQAVAAEHHAEGNEILAADELLEPGADEFVKRDRHWWLVRGLGQRAAPAQPPLLLSLDEGESTRLAPFLHPAIAERLRSGRRELVNELRTVTAVFVGLQAVHVVDRQAVDALQRFLASAVRIIAHYGGHFRHLAASGTGSVVVAFFGAPVGHEDDEERAVRCSLELLGLPGGPYRAGVATGAVYCGEVGTDSRREYAVIGDSVNLAARLLSAAGGGQLLVDRATYERISHNTVHERLAPLAVKGKAGRIDVWAVRSVREQRAALPEPAVDLPLVGRGAEVARIRSLIDRARADEGRVILLTGDAGIGKSRLVAEVVKSARRSGFAVFGGAARSHARTTSYLVWHSIWRDLLGLDASLSVAEQQAWLVKRLTRHVSDAAHRAPLLAPILNLPLPDSALTAPLDPRTRDGLLRALLLTCLCDVASSTPTLLVLEDCHWIDPASAALLDFLARNIADRPVLIVVTARGPVADTPATASLSRLAHSSELHLTDLARPEAELLIGLHVRKRYPAAADVDPQVIARIAEQGDGNPLYLEELVSYLHAKGVDLRNALARDALELPGGLQRLLTARLDQLSEGEKATIKVASVIGRRFRASWIADAYPGAGGLPEVARHLERLHQLDLTPRRSDAPDPEFQFKHAMTQETAYQSLTFRMRESLHERVGTLIESANAGRLDQYIDVLAHHYGRTQRVDKQRVWFRAGGDAAKTAFANDTAVAYYQRLLPLLPDGEMGEVLIELGGVMQLTGEWAEAERSYRRAMEVAADAGRPEILAAGQRDLGDLFMYTRSHAEAVAWLRRAADGFDRLGDRVGLSLTLEPLAFALYRQGAYEEALATAERHQALATAAGDLRGVSIALSTTGLVRLETGHPHQARELLQQALDTAARADDRVRLLHAANNLTLLHLRHGEHRPAVMHGFRAFEVAQEIGFRQTAALVVGNLGEVYRDEGDHVQATRCFAYALRIALDLRDWTTIGDQVANLAATGAAQGLDQEAERLFDRAIAIGRHLDAPYLLCSWLHRLATLHVEQGRFEEAERLNQEALEIAETHDERGLRLRAFVLEQRLRVVVGRARPDEPIAHLRELAAVRTDPHERALVLEAIWRLDPTAEAARSAAAHLYRDLYERTPAVEYRAAHAFLTGVALPAGPPLPPLPTPLDKETADVDELLRQADRIMPQLTGVADVQSGALETSK